MALTITWTRGATKDALALPHMVRYRILKAVEALALNPTPPGCKKLTNEDDGWRLRVGDYRVLYRWREGAVEIVVVTCGHRREVYR
ncbi:type II toxin-antitoxin system RelE/ParE family toxin [Myxococcota bacterium]|nr:type II toxin-antitoxin system RelE/ParE family toxin [Myxococcota bacterium]